MAGKSKSSVAVAERAPRARAAKPAPGPAAATNTRESVQEMLRKIEIRGAQIDADLQKLRVRLG